MAYSVKKVRDLFAQADRYRSLAGAAMTAGAKIRLGQTPVMSGGFLWFRGRESYPDQSFTKAEASAIEAALRIVERDYEKIAAELESQAVQS